jgi:decaprenylphospho-beta-D-erythro-pentofuranosid-2-ulose 2-reductase
MKFSTVLIVGATSSLAQALCRALAQEGSTLILAGRDGRELQLLAGDLITRYHATCRVIVADLLSADFSPVHFMEQAGGFDDAIIAVGDMGGDDPADPINIAYTTYINHTLPAQMAALAAEHLGAKGRGSIVIISSVAGDRGRQSNYLYGSAKAALSTFASGLRNRYRQHGVHVLTVKPGFTDTTMTWGMKSSLMASREFVAGKIIKAMKKRKDVIYVPAFWRVIMLIITHIPEKIFKRLKL